MLSILIVDDDQTLALTLAAALTTHGHKVSTAQSGSQALAALSQNPDRFDVALLDVNMPGMTGIETLEAIRTDHPKIFCMMLTAYADVADAVKAIKLGAFDYLEKPVDPLRVLKSIDRALEAKELVEFASISAPNFTIGSGKTIVGESVGIRRVFELIYKLCRVDTSVLIRGESGTGKELVAQALHYNSHRKKGPFVAVNCAAIPESLIESELFGHERGAFTGADRKKPGKFQVAHNGTLFLDEIGDMSLQAQVKLLRVLQDKKYTPVGSTQECHTDVRIVAATSRPLEEMMSKGTFRSDLFYRLNVLPIHLPALKDRLEDLPKLCEFIIQKFNRVHRRTIEKVSPEAMMLLKNHQWPGNIRELENVMEHAFIVESNNEIFPSSLPDHLQHCASSATVSSSDGEAELRPKSLEFLSGATAAGSESNLNFPALKEQFEREFIIKALRAFKGRINQTAQHTDMTKVTLLRKLEKYGINPRDFYARH